MSESAAYSLYEGVVLTAKAALTSLDGMLTKAEEHPSAASFLSVRLIEDMNPLSFQIHYASYQGECIAAKLTGQTPLERQDDVDAFDKAHARVQMAIKALDALDRDECNQIAETDTTFDRGQGVVMDVPVKDVVGLLNFPNVVFHVNMAYAILRKEGVPLGKRDWSRLFVTKYV